MNRYETLTFHVFATPDQRLTLIELKAITATVVVEAIMQQRNFLRKKHPTGALTDLGKFDRVKFLKSYLEDKGDIIPINMTDFNVIAGATKIAEAILREPGKDEKTKKKKVPGQYQLNYRGGVNYMFNLIVNNRQTTPNLGYVPLTKKVGRNFDPPFIANFPHLEDIKLILTDEKRTIEDIQKVFEFYRPVSGLFKENNDYTNHENYWTLTVVFVHKDLYEPLKLTLPPMARAPEPFVIRTAYHTRLQKAEEKNRVHTSCKNDPLSLK